MVVVRSVLGILHGQVQEAQQVQGALEALVVLAQEVLVELQ